MKLNKSLKEIMYDRTPKQPFKNPACQNFNTGDISVNVKAAMKYKAKKKKASMLSGYRARQKNRGP